ncbi:MAG: DUF4919 domain-containing protein [Spirochaetales bacterium]|nr:DUF4919 domain-containing protein [Spirochaetales bacterium]
MIKNYTRIALLCCFCLTGIAVMNAQEAEDQPPSGNGIQDGAKVPWECDPPEYGCIVDQCMKGEEISFTELRIAFSRTEQYSPYNSEITDEIRKLNDAERYQEAALLADEHIRTLLGDLDFVYEAIVAFANSGNEHVDFAKYVFWGIIDSISQSGNGQSYATALKVISVREEYLYMMVNDITHTRQMLQDDNGHMFDVFEIEAGPESPFTDGMIYFNIDVIMKAMQDMFN